MSLEGLISTSALFHEKDGTSGINVVSLPSAESYTTGKIAVVTGTCNTTGVEIDITATGYTMADGTTASWSSRQDINRIVFSATPEAILEGNEFLLGLKVSSSNGRVCVTEVPGGLVGTSGTPEYLLTAKVPNSLFGQTASFTVVIVGD